MPKWTDAGGDFEQPPEGSHVARCIKMIDIGTQEGEYQGKPTRKRQCIIGWELPHELMQEGEYAGKPFSVSKFYTQSLGEKANLRKDLINWRGRDFTPEELAGFDAKNIIGKTCMVSLTKNEKGRTKVSGVIALPKGMQVPTQVNPTVFLSLEPEEFSTSTFDALSDKMKAMITDSPEYNALFGRIAVEAAAPVSSGKPVMVGAFDDLDEDIPF